MVLNGYIKIIFKKIDEHWVIKQYIALQFYLEFNNNSKIKPGYSEWWDYKRF